MYQVWIAYVLWLLGGCGALGLHRFYMKKIPTGVLWVCTGGLGMIGAIYDFFTLTRQVNEANQRLGIPVGNMKVEVHHTHEREKEPLERAILRLAQAHQGQVTPAMVAASSDWSIEAAQKALDQMVRQKHCELRVQKSGTLVYHFREFDPQAEREFEI